jgi:geranylgeranyl diphosphate synthase, type II
MGSAELQNLLQSLRAEVDARLPAALAELGGPARLQEAMAYSLLAPGKRLRPILVLMATEAAGGKRQQGMPAAIAVEMVHTYSLIHDDLPAMDDDDLRRGRPTCHKKFGEALAILAGDALLTGAFQQLTDYPATMAAVCMRELAIGAGARGMVGGQVDDLHFERTGTGTLSDLEQIHATKTGALITACLRLGGLVGHGGEPTADTVVALDGFGRSFGLAFQITDDLLDVEGEAAEVGKQVGKDADRGKLTYPQLLGVAESRHREAVRKAAESAGKLGPAGEPLAALAGYLIGRRQ